MQLLASNSFKIKRDGSRRYTENAPKYFKETHSSKIEEVLSDPIVDRKLSEPKKIESILRSNSLLKAGSYEEILQSEKDVQNFLKAETKSLQK